MARHFRVLKLLFSFTFNVCWALAYLSAYLSKIIASFFVQSKDEISTKPGEIGIFWNGGPSRNSGHDYMYRVYVVEFQCFTYIETSNVKMETLPLRGEPLKQPVNPKCCQAVLPDFLVMIPSSSNTTGMAVFKTLIACKQMTAQISDKLLCNGLQTS